MPRQSQRKTDAMGIGDRPSVTLIAPDGSGSTTVMTTSAFNNLVYGQGYRPEGVSTEDAYARLLDESTGDDPTPMTEAPTEG